MKKFTYKDPITKQKVTVNVTSDQIKAIKTQLKAVEKAIRAFQKTGMSHVQAVAAVQSQMGGAYNPQMVYSGLPPIGPNPSGSNTLQPSSNIMPGLMTGSPMPSNQFPNVMSPCGTGCAPIYGWVANALGQLAASRRFAISVDRENQIIVGNTQPLILAYPDSMSLMQAASLAVQGDATKAINQALWPAQTTPTDLVLPVGAAKVFGLRVRISNSVLNFKFGAYTMEFVDNASGTPLVRSAITVQVRRLPLDIIWLSVSNAAGLATVVPSADAGVRMLAASNPALVPTSDLIYVETLNQRDIGSVQGVGPTLVGA